MHRNLVGGSQRKKINFTCSGVEKWENILHIMKQRVQRYKVVNVCTEVHMLHSPQTVRDRYQSYKNTIALSYQALLRIWIKSHRQICATKVKNNIWLFTKTKDACTLSRNKLPDVNYHAYMKTCRRILRTYCSSRGKFRSNASTHEELRRMVNCRKSI